MNARKKLLCRLVWSTNVWSKFTERTSSKSRMKERKNSKNKKKTNIQVRREFHCHRLHSQGPPVRLGKRQNRSGRLRPSVLLLVFCFFFLPTRLLGSCLRDFIPSGRAFFNLLPRTWTKQLAHEPSIASWTGQTTSPKIPDKLMGLCVRVGQAHALWWVVAFISYSRNKYARVFGGRKRRRYLPRLECRRRSSPRFKRSTEGLEKEISRTGLDYGPFRPAYSFVNCVHLNVVPPCDLAKKKEAAVSNKFDFHCCREWASE